MHRSRRPAPLVAALVALAVGWAVLGHIVPRAAAAGVGTVWVQTMDSCKQALGGAGYVLSGGGVTMSADDPPATKQRVASTSQCPLQRGTCRTGMVGCASFSNVPAGTYTLREVRTPAADSSNPEGYAPCEGGSACRSEVASVTVGADGRVGATVTNLYPDGMSVTWPSGGGRRGGGAYTATQTDPIVFHDFGLAPPGRSGQCDGDSDADDHLTGSPSGHCAYPEAEEDSACKPFPWSCSLAPASSGAVRPR